MKTRIKQVVLSLIFLVVYDVSVFLLVKDMTNSQLITLAFVHVSYALMLFLLFSAPAGKNRAVIGYPGIMLAAQYFAVELVLGTIYMVIRESSVAWTVIPQMTLAGIYAAILIMNSLTNERIVVDATRDEGHVEYVRQTVAMLQRIRLGVSDAEISRRLDRVEDALRYAQVASDPSMASIEAATLSLLARLEAAVEGHDITLTLGLCDSIENNVNLRDTDLSVRRRP